MLKHCPISKPIFSGPQSEYLKNIYLKIWVFVFGHMIVISIYFIQHNHCFNQIGSTTRGIRNSTNSLKDVISTFNSCNVSVFKTFMSLKCTRQHVKNINF